MIQYEYEQEKEKTRKEIEKILDEEFPENKSNQRVIRKILEVCEQHTLKVFVEYLKSMNNIH